MEPDDAPAPRPDDLGVGSRGIWTRAQALAVVTPGQLRGVLDRGEWQVVLPGTYADGGVLLDAGQRAVAATIGRRGAIAAGRTAARWWGFPLIDDDDPATGARDRGIDDIATASTRTTRLRTPAPTGPADRVATATTGQVRQVRERRLVVPASDTVDIGGALVLSPARTLVDCVQVLAFDALVCAVDDALHRDVVALDELARRPELAAALAVADGRSESPLETLGRLLLLPVLPGLVPQVEVFDAAMRLVARIDLADEARRFGVEADGRSAHSRPTQVTRDVGRGDRVSGQGWGPLSRFGWFEIRTRPAALRERVLREFARHARPAA